ncbi:MAG: hypothetical protein VYC34_04180, partial [Planctomycetota bacterium]|nr:hypothetical protein [Planctomycetota bacterium]
MSDHAPLVNPQAFAEMARKPLERLPNPMPITPLPQSFNIDLTPPGSKSLSNRALLLAALADGESAIHNPLLDAEDARRMVEALRVLGATIEASDDRHMVRVRGVGGRLRGGASVNLGNAGTATRFLAAAAGLLAEGPVTIDGDARMRQRPIDALRDALGELGCGVEHLGDASCPPVRLTPPAEAPRGAELTLPTTASSQFISALLLVAPWLPDGLTLRLEGEVTSRSYVVMTLELLRVLGAKVSASEDLA